MPCTYASWIHGGEGLLGGPPRLEKPRKIAASNSGHLRPASAPLGQGVHWPASRCNGMPIGAGRHEPHSGWWRPVLSARYVDFPGTKLGALRNVHCQHAVLEACLDLPGLEFT